MKLGRNLPSLVTMGVFVLLYAACAAQFPFMLSGRVAGNLLTDNAFLGVLAVGMTVVILSGGIDLSVGAVVAFVGVLLAILIGDGVNPFLAFTLALAAGTAFGALLGAAIHLLQAPPFIVTLAGMFLARGACFLLTTESIPIDHPAYAELASGGAGLSVSAWVMLLAFAGGAVMLRLTRFGADVRAIGGDARAAELIGVRIGRTTAAIYAFSGFCAALAGILFSIYTQSAHSLAGVGLELDAIAAVVIGGTLLSGGYGGLLGSFFGVMILGLIQSYIIFTGTLSSWWAKIAAGLLLFLFIVVQRVLMLLPRRAE
ncbi:galactofuranose ABC transporter, permease protein YjfF [Sphingomonas sp.]|jgi:simple sugar transport system permease protein|uniref:galactofuranose ABC transporter, permease protein YjfF n=1 Tax=Sphingomonas sp. TaxID=28214 RepID=UPI002EDAE1A9